MAVTLKEVFWKKIRSLHRAESTGRAYWKWIVDYCDFHHDPNQPRKSPRTLREPEATRWLDHLANERRLSESAHEQAFYALVFLYSQIYSEPLKDVRSQRPKPKINVPVVLSVAEVSRVLEQMPGVYRLIAGLLYGCGFRRSEALNLRLKDCDNDNRMFSVWHSKHKMSRTVRMPERLVPAIAKQSEYVRAMQARDRETGTGGIIKPIGDARSRTVSFDPGWYWLFPSEVFSRDPISGRVARFHLCDKHLGDLVTQAAKRAGIVKRVTPHTFRHSYATHQLAAGVNLRQIQRALGHRDVTTTEIYAHVSVFADQQITSPMDRMVGGAIAL